MSPFSTVTLPTKRINILLSRRRALLFLLLFLVGVILIPESPLFLQVPGHDSGMYGYVGWRILHGEIPYRDIWDHKPPLIYYIDALGLLLGQGSMWGIWLLQFLFLYLATIFGYFFLKRAFGTAPALVTTVAWLMTLTLLGEMNRPETMALFCQFTALLLFLQAEDKGYTRHGYLLGATAAAAFFLKPNLVGVWLALTAYLIVSRLRTRRARELLRALLTMFAGAGAVTAVILAYLALNGALDEFVDTFFRFNLAYGQAPLLARLLVVSEGLRVTGQSGLALTALAGWLGALFYLLLARTEVRAPVPVLLVGLVALPLEFIMASLPGETYSHYYIPWLPVLALLTAFFFSALLSLSRSGKHRSLAYMWLFALLLAMSALPAAGLANRVAGAYRREATAYRTALDAADYVRQNTAVETSVLVWGFGARVNFMARRTSPTRFVYQTPLYMPGYQTPELVQSFAQDLAVNKPALILDTWTGSVTEVTDFATRQRQFWQEATSAGWRPLPEMDAIFTYIATHYEYAGTVGPERWAVYRYKGSESE